MAEPELGFVASKNEGTQSSSRQPHLNAREEHTLVVDGERPTQVGGGGVQCALDGGTFEIGLYDIADGVEGAPLVFSQEVTLPERPLDGEDGYEVDTYTFEFDPVPLREYAGRELAVAGIHKSARIWGNNSRDTSNPGFYRGDDSRLSDSWSGGLRDGYAPRSMGLFVDPVDIPQGKGRTVVGSDILDDRSRTVFAAFPDRSPERGATIQYDEQTEAGASVTVLPNGALKFGQGSAATDSIEVSLRDGDGTWHGPRTVTLTETAGPATVTASDTKIAPGEQAIPSLTAGGVDTLTLGQLWTDWGVQVQDPAGGTVQNSVSETGELTLQWDAVTSEVAPSIALDPPAETYVGGTYAIEVVAERDGDSATDTMLLDIGSGSAGQTAPSEGTAASDTETTATTSDTTTLVAARAPDGSRLTSRPDGPVYHTNDGTHHLFTWNEPAPGARAVLYDEDDTTDWGEGPDIHLYDRMERPDAEVGDVPSLRGTTGEWQLDYNGSPDLRSDSHSGEFAARIQKQREIRRFRTEFDETTEVFLSYCVKIPEGKAMLGAEEPGEFPESSVWKMSWLFHDDTQDGEDVDICLPSWTPKLSISGNSLNPAIQSMPVGEPDWWQWGEWLRFSFWLECGDPPRTADGRIRFQVVAEGEGTQVVADAEVPVMEGGVSPYTWQRLNIPSWSDNRDDSGEDTNAEKVEALYDDIYVATGANSNARIELSDSTDYGASTRMQLCDIRSWSSNRVSATLRKGSLDSVENATLHLTTAEERQAVSMEVS